MAVMGSVCLHDRSILEKSRRNVPGNILTQTATTNSTFPTLQIANHDTRRDSDLGLA